jgi:hypothetical protein
LGTGSSWERWQKLKEVLGYSQNYWDSERWGIVGVGGCLRSSVHISDGWAARVVCTVDAQTDLATG